MRGSYFCWGGSLAQHHLLGQVRHLLGVSPATATPQPGFPVQVGRAVSPLVKDTFLPLGLSPGDPRQVPIAPASPTSWGSAFRFFMKQRQGKTVLVWGRQRSQGSTDPCVLSTHGECSP